MTTPDATETQAFWNRIAHDWDRQVGDSGDKNRRLNSDPVLWSFLGDVRGRRVLDAGCGTGYLSRQLHERGANVIGIDFSEEMIRIAREKAPGIGFRVGSCSSVHEMLDRPVDVVVSNYVLMDTPDLKGTIESFFRALRADGEAVVVFSHPCFPAGRARFEKGTIEYRWEHSYFEPTRNVDPPWAHFTSDFIWFHRPLSDYWKAFRSAGFSVIDFEEPRISEDRHPMAESEKQLLRAKTRPYSVAFRLKKPQA